jgi:hypothetical protein
MYCAIDEPGEQGKNHEKNKAVEGVEKRQWVEPTG